MELLKKITFFVTSLLLSSCAVKPQFHVPQSLTPSEPHKLVVLFDGTANDEKSHTNISKLRSLITLQKRTNIRTAYITGVGSGTRFIGMATGWGFSQDLREAYEFLTVNHQSNEDEVYLFGFSRGAFAARALAGFVQVAGIPDFSGLTQGQRKKIVSDLLTIYKSRGSIHDRREAVETRLRNWNQNYVVDKNFKIKFVGIWDTVEAIGLPDKIKNVAFEGVGFSGPSYIHQLCNVENVAHALSLDDDRANVFRPVFLTKTGAVKQCKEKGESRGQTESRLSKRSIQQVFFSGAHSDVGGGYKDTDIDGVSFNWMLSAIKPYKLVPEGTEMYADDLGKTHDPESGVMKVFYPFKHRDISKYKEELGGELTVHQSVIDRLKHIPRKCHEIQWLDENNAFKNCFREEGGLLKYDESACGFEVKADPLYLRGKWEGLSPIGVTLEYCLYDGDLLFAYPRRPE